MIFLNAKSILALIPFRWGSITRDNYSDRSCSAGQDWVTLVTGCNSELVKKKNKQENAYFFPLGLKKCHLLRNKKPPPPKNNKTKQNKKNQRHDQIEQIYKFHQTNKHKDRMLWKQICGICEINSLSSNQCFIYRVKVTLLNKKTKKIFTYNNY